MRAVVRLSIPPARFIRAASSSAPFTLDARQDLHREIGILTSSFHECQKDMASAKYTARLNPHSLKCRERADKIQNSMERFHDQFQMLLQREAHKTVTGAEIAFSGYKDLFEPRSWHYNVLMDSFRRHSPRQCGSLLKRMDCDGVAPDVDFFNLWLRALSTLDVNLPTMYGILEEMARRGIQPDRFTHSIMLEVLAGIGDADLVNSTLDSMVNEGISPTPSALAKVLALYWKVKDYEKGDTIRDSLLHAKDASYSLGVYSAIMRYSIARAHLDVVESVWDIMDAKDTRPSPDVFDQYVTALFDGRFPGLDLPESRKLLRKVLDRAITGFVRLTLRPILPFLPQLIAEYSQRPDVLAMFFDAVAQSNFPAKLAVQESFCNWFYEKGDLELLKLVLDTMSKAGLSPQSLGHAIIGKCILTNPSACQELVRYMVKKGIPVYREAMTSIIFAGANRSDLESCDEVSAIMKDLGMTPTESSINAHLNAAIYANSTNRIDELFAESRQLGYTLNNECAQYLLVSLSARGELEACTYLFQMLKENGSRVPTALEYDSMIAAIIKTGDPLGAIGLIREMCSHNHPPSYSLLYEVINSFVTRGLLDDAEHLIEGLPRDRLADFTVTCSNLITALAQLGELERCERVCSLLEESGGFPRIWAVNALIIAFGNVGMVDMSEKIFSLLMQRNPPHKARSSAYNALLSVLARNALFDECGKLIGEFQVHNIKMELFAFRYLVSSFAFRGRLDECEASYSHFSSNYFAKLDTVFEWLATPYARASALDRLRAFARKSASSSQECEKFLSRIDSVERKLARKSQANSGSRFPRL